MHADPAPVHAAAAPAATPLPHAAAPAAVHPVPVPDASVDLGVAPLTRRQAREQERIRTASIPVIVHDVPDPADPPRSASPWSPTPTPVPRTPAAPATGPEPASGREDAAVLVEERTAPAAPEHDVGEGPDRTVVHPALGAELLAGDPAPAPAPSSFEELLGRGTATTGSTTAPHALILPHPASAPLVAPIDGTGEVLVTGTFALPDGLGSTGHVPGTTDGREVDAVLVDGELPAQSSPTPISASAAVSTIRTDDDIVNPPAPEKGRRLMMTLAITAGVLALALIGVLVYALASGVIA